MADCIKSGRKEHFTVLYNSMITDRRLSLKAKGLFAVMMSRPDNWEFSVSGLAAFVGVGKDSIRSTLTELEEVGYLLRSQAHDSAGHFSGNVYVLQDIAPPLSGKPDDGETRQRETPSSGNPTQRNKDYKERKTKEPPIVPPIVSQEIFELCQNYAGDDRELLDAILGLLENRAKLQPKPKPVKTTKAMNGILRNLDKLSGGRREVKLAMLEKATVHDWLTVYTLKPDELPGGSYSVYSEEGHDGI